MNSDNLTTADRVPDWVFRLDALPPDPLYVPGDEPPAAPETRLGWLPLALAVVVLAVVLIAVRS